MKKVSAKAMITIAAIAIIEDVEILGISPGKVATIPPKIFESMFLHPLTDKGLKSFLSDWKGTGQSIL